MLLVVSTGEPVAQAGSSARAEIQELLDRRARAIIERDKDAFMSTVLPDADGFERRQRLMFDGFGDVALSDYELTAEWDRLGDLARNEESRRYDVPANDIALPLTVERYRLAGMDPEAALEDVYYTYVRRDGRWYVAGDTDLEDVGLYSARHLWDPGTVETYRTARFTLFAHPCTSDCVDVDAMGRHAERALDRVAHYWGELPRRTAVLVPEDVAELERMIQSTFDLDNFVAFAYSSEDPDRGYTGNRVLLNPDSFRDIDPTSAFVILAHEMLHIATRAAAGPFVPIFVEEGFADYVGNDASDASLGLFRSDVAAGRFGGTVPQDFEFTTGSGTNIFRSYQESQAAIGFFIERWGLNRFESFYRRLGRVQIAPGTTRYWLDRSLHRSIGIDLKRFEDLWADSIDST